MSSLFEHVKKLLLIDGIGSINDILTKEGGAKIAINESITNYRSRVVRPLSNNVTYAANQDLIIPLTDDNFDIVEFQNSYITLNVDTDLMFNGGIPVNSTTAFPSWYSYGGNPDWTTNETAVTVAKNTYIFVGFKNSTDIIESIMINNNKKEISSTYTDKYALQSFLLGMVKPFIEKENKRNQFSLWHNVHNFDQSICGQYISYWDLYQASLRRTNRIHINFPIVIKFDDTLHFLSLSEYPVFAFGELSITLRLSLAGLVWCNVDPIASLKQGLLTQSIETDVVFRNIQDICKKLHNSLRSIIYDHKFNQVNVPARCATNLLIHYDASMFADRSFYDVKDITIIPDNIRIDTVETTIIGYNLDQRYKNAFRAHHQDRPWVIPAEKMSINVLPGTPSQNGINISQNFTVSCIKSFCFLFPLSPYDCTCFQNPCLQNAYIQFNGSNYPSNPTNTLSPEHLKSNLDAMALNGFFYPPQEIENSYTYLPSYQYPTKGNVPEDNTSYAWWTLLDRPSSTAFFSSGISGNNLPVKLTASYIQITDPNKSSPDVVDNLYILNRHDNDPSKTPQITNGNTPFFITVSYSFWIFRVDKPPLYIFDKPWNDIFSELYPNIYTQQLNVISNM
jgi:hypothetical protein